MFDTQPILLKDLLDDVSSGSIQLPDFQRGWIWDDYRIRGLLASISRGFPVGAILTLAAGGDVKFKPRPIEGVKSAAGDKRISTEPSTFLLDGQQRLTSLYQALVHPGPVKTQSSKTRRIERWYYIDMLKAIDPEIEREEVFVSVPKDRKTTDRFGKRILMDLSSPELEFENHMMPTERLLGGMKWILRYNQYWDSSKENHPSGDLANFLEEFNDLIINTFGAYLLPVITLGKTTPKEAVCKVFEKVNTGGVTLTVFELMTATFAAYDDKFYLREDWSKRSTRLRERYGALQGIEGEHFLQAVALLTTNERRKTALAKGVPENQAPGISCKKDTILALTLSNYLKWAAAIEKGLEEAAAFLFSQFIFSSKDVPYASQIIPLATLYVELGEELQPAQARSLLERWYWSGVFGESYGGNTETQFALDLRQVSEYIRGGGEPTLIAEASFIPERLLTLKTRNSAAYKGLYAMQMKNRAADWRTGVPIFFDHWISTNINIHHVYPKTWCRGGRNRPEIPHRLCDSIINKTPIDAQTNRIIGGRGPSSYIPRLEKEYRIKNLDQILQAHWLRPELLRNDDFGNSFVERGVKMLDLIGSSMGKPISGGRKVFTDALSSAGVAAEYVDDTSVDDDVGEVGRYSSGVG